MVCELSREPLNQWVDHIKELKSTVRVKVAKVLQQMIDVLLNSRALKWILEEELSENRWAHCPRWLWDTRDHHLLHLLNQIIEVSTHKLPVDDRSQTMEHIALRVAVQIMLYYMDEGL